MSRSLQFSVFTNLRQASSFYTQAHSKDGNNISARLVVNAYMNFKQRNGEEKSEVISLTAWDKAADILALTLTPGKEFTVFADLNVYQAPVYWNDQIVNAPDGSGAMQRKAYSYTIRRFDLGNDSFKHIMNEIQHGVRGPQWWVKGSQDAIGFKAELDRRMALVGHFDPRVHSQRFGFAEVKQPKYTFGAYHNSPMDAVNAVMSTAQPAAGNAANAASVAQAFTGVTQPAAQPQPMPAPPATPGNVTANFVMPQGV